MFVVATRNFPPDLGGMQNLMEGLSNGLLNHGPVKVFADSFANAETYDASSKLQIQRIGGFKIFRKFRKASLVNEFLNKNQVRAVFFDHWKSIENIKIEALNKQPSFCLIHSKEINHDQGSSLNKRMLAALSRATFIIANSNFTKNLIKEKGMTATNIHVIHPGCNYPITVSAEANTKAQQLFGQANPKIITVARLDKRKNHEKILMTIKNLIPKFPNIKYISIGDGEEKNNLLKLKTELSLNKEVEFIFNSSEQEKVALLSNADLCFMPSIISKKSVEGFGITFIEAAAYGVGSIGGKDGGQVDAIQHNQTGLICDGNDLSAIYEAIIKFFENNNNKKFGAAAKEFSKKFNWSLIVKEYLKLLN